MARLILGSASPRRQEILQGLGLTFEVRPSHVHEPPFTLGDVAEYALSLARLKAAAVVETLTNPQAAVIAADTIVVVDDDVLGKPADRAEAAHMLARLSGRAHDVVTAVVVRHGEGGEQACTERTRVWFRACTSQELDRYAATDEGADKAGAYAIQGLGAGLVDRIAGSYTNVVGLPAAQTLELLRRAGALGDWP